MVVLRRFGSSGDGYYSRSRHGSGWELGATQCKSLYHRRRPNRPSPPYPRPQSFRRLLHLCQQLLPGQHTHHIPLLFLDRPLLQCQQRRLGLYQPWPCLLLPGPIPTGDPGLRQGYPDRPGLCHGLQQGNVYDYRGQYTKAEADYGRACSPDSQYCQPSTVAAVRVS